MESVLDDLLGSVGKPMRLGRQAPAEYIVSLEQGDPNTALSQYGRRDTPSDTAADNNGRHVAAYPHRTDESDSTTTWGGRGTLGPHALQLRAQP